MTEDRIIAELQLARAETGMDIAVLGEISGGCEVVRCVAGDSSFGLFPGRSIPLANTYCDRLLTGRIANVVPDVAAEDRLRDVALTGAARIGAYIGVPLTGADARIYVLCCLAHERRSQLSERDVLFLRGIGEAILAELAARPAGAG